MSVTRKTITEYFLNAFNLHRAVARKLFRFSGLFKLFFDALHTTRSIMRYILSLFLIVARD